MSSPAEPPTTVRLDKWLDVARAFKSRSQASRACSLGRVRVNGAKAKPHRTVSIDDRIEIQMRKDWKRILVVVGLADRNVSKAEARELYVDESPPRPDDPIARMMRQQPEIREAGAGRPTKRDRRRIDRLKNSS